MKTNVKFLIASLALTLSSTTAFAASPEALLVSNISCQEGTRNVEVIRSKLAGVGQMTTRGHVESVLLENAGEKRDKGGAIEGSKQIRYMISTNGDDKSFCSNNGNATYLIVTIAK